MIMDKLWTNLPETDTQMVGQSFWNERGKYINLDTKHLKDFHIQRILYF